MKKNLLFFACFVFLVGVPFLVNAGDEISATFSSKIWSKYHVPNSVVVHDEPVLQNNLLTSLPKGFYFNIWHSMGLDDVDLSSNSGDELDLTFGWSGSWKEFGLDMGITYIDGLPTFRMKRGDFIQPYLELSRGLDIADEHLLTPFTKIELLFPLDGGDNLADIFGGIKHNWQLSDRFAVSQKVYLLCDDAGSGNGALVGGYEMDFNWNIKENITFSPLMLKTTAPFSSVNDGRRPEATIGVGISFVF
ncbi:hypothetical protein ACFL1O_00045 [Patescibacteria group bacterium]